MARPQHTPSNQVSPANAPLMAQGVDVSKRAGAYQLGKQIRLYWLRRGWDVPVKVNLVAQEINGGKCKDGSNKARMVYSPQADFTAAKRLNAIEQTTLEFELVNEQDGEGWE
jgi:hypothetical protein